MGTIEINFKSVEEKIFINFFKIFKLFIAHNEVMLGTDLNSKIALSRVVNLKEVGAGLVLEYD